MHAQLVVGLASIAAVFGALVNITVDDNDRGVVYSPADDWSFGPECSTCTVHVDANQTYKGTWHDTLFSSMDAAENATQTVSYIFTGTGIYVYGILSNANDGPSGNADQVFFIDNEQVFTFKHTPSGDGSLVYNQILYSNPSLPDGPHTLNFQNGQSGDLSSLILFDYLVYTTDSDSPESGAPVIGPSLTSSVTSSLAPMSSQPSSLSSSSSTSPTGSDTQPTSTHSSTKRTTTIILSVLLPVLALLLALLVTLFICYRRRLRNRGLDAQPYTSQSRAVPALTDPDPPRTTMHKSSRAFGNSLAVSPVSDTPSGMSFNPPTTSVMANAPYIIYVTNSPPAPRMEGMCMDADPAHGLAVGEDRALRHRASQESDETLGPVVFARPAVPAGGSPLARAVAVGSAEGMEERRWSRGTELPSYEAAQLAGGAQGYERV